MIRALVLAVACAGDPGAEDVKAVTAIRTAYEHNRAALSTRGTIHFEGRDGKVTPRGGLDSIDEALKTAWERRSPSRGLYVFDGASRRYENLYTPEQLVARRTRLSPTSTSSTISSERLLTDGDSTLIDHVAVALDDKTILHNPNVVAGSRDFFRIGEGIPLQLGNPEPARYEMGRCLGNALAGQEGATLSRVDDKALLGGHPVVKITVEHPRTAYKMQVTFWVDIERGAVPIQSRIISYIPHAGTSAVLQYNNDAIRWVGKGWLPFRFSAAQGDLSSEGKVATLFVREFTVGDADFTGRPDSSLFALDFPTEYSVSDSHRLLSFGSRRVWALKDFSAAARAKARPIQLASPGNAPIMPGASEGAAWLAPALVLLGAGLLIAAGTLLIRRSHRHA
jgi:hypothetical protein